MLYLGIISQKRKNMRVYPKALPLTVNEHICLILDQMSKKRNINSSLKERIRIVLLGIEGRSSYSCAKELGFSIQKITRWRERWESEVDQLLALEKENKEGNPATDNELITQIERVLSDKPRSGTPKRISMAEEQSLIALACEEPEKYGIPMTNWTHEMLAHVAKVEGLIPEISKRHVGNILKKTKSSPTNQNIGYFRK